MWFLNKVPDYSGRMNEGFSLKKNVISAETLRIKINFMEGVREKNLSE